MTRYRAEGEAALEPRSRRPHTSPNRTPRAVEDEVVALRKELDRGFVVPQPRKRPRSSWRRFAAEMPTECWQLDITPSRLADGREVEILNILDDHSLALSPTAPWRCSRPTT